MMERFHSGPEVGSQADNFRVYDHENRAIELGHLLGESGVLLGFASNIWDLSAVRHVLWLQRQSYKLSLAGVNCAMLMPNEPYELSGFYMSIPRQIAFPILADPNNQAFDAYEIEFPGFVLVNGDGIIEKKWFLKGDSTPRIREVLQLAGV